MEQLKLDKGIINEKVKFIKDNAAILFFIKSETCSKRRTVEEALANILLSNKELAKCPDYIDLLNKIDQFDYTGITFEEKKNYALSLLISIANYLNGTVKSIETNSCLKNRIRLYTKRVDSYLTDDSVIIEKDKIKTKKKEF